MTSSSTGTARIRRALCLALAGLLALSLTPGAAAHPEGSDSGKDATLLDPKEEPEDGPGAGPSQQGNRPLSHEPCVQGFAGEFPCDNVDLMSYLPIDEVGGGPGSIYGGAGNDLWGWTDPDTRQEWALMGRTTGTGFVDVTDAKRPVFVADLPTQTSNSLWRDIKTYDNHAFVVSEAGGHGMQIFDLTRLRDLDENLPVTVEPDAHYDEFGNAHNVAINEDSGFAYAVGTSTCAGGLHMVDISDPKNPSFAGCYADEGYTHDVQCVNYHGPDERFAGHEICVASNPGTAEGNVASIIDVTDKENPQLLSRATYSPTGYSHQGWLTDDHRFYLHNDEFNEFLTGSGSLTHIFDFSSLTEPEFLGNYESTEPAVTHNLYNRGRYSYQSNYLAGLRVLDITGITDGELTEVGYFDVSPDVTEIAFGGTWSNYPFFDSGNVLVGGFDGLWVVRPRIGVNAPLPPPGQDHRPANQAARP